MAGGLGGEHAETKVDLEIKVGVESELDAEAKVGLEGKLGIETKLGICRPCPEVSLLLADLSPSANTVVLSIPSCPSASE